MAITPETFRIARRYRQHIRDLTDEQVLELTRRWVEAWDELSIDLDQVFREVAAQHVSTGITPQGLARDDRIVYSVIQVRDRLGELIAEAHPRVAGEIRGIMTGGISNLEDQWQSQLPRGWRPPEGSLRAFQVTTEETLDWMVQRSSGSILSRLRPIPDDQAEVMRRNLFRGIAEGANPRAVARRMMQHTRGAFDGGLARAATIARTEMIDAHRAATQAHRQRNDIVTGWVWTATLDHRVCMSCLDLHGTMFPKDQFGPEDHPNGRCVAVDKLESWADLGIDLPELDDHTEDAREWFEGLTEETQLQIMGPSRFEAWQNGDVGWGRFAERRENTDWRPYYIQRPVKDL